MIIPDHLYKKILGVMPIPCVDLLIINTKNQVLLVRRRNEPAAGQWWFPGGRVHLGETRRAAAIRKLQEECNLTVYKIKEMGTYDCILNIKNSIKPSHGITTLFKIQIKNHEQLSLDAQSKDVRWLKVIDWQKLKLHPFIISVLNNLPSEWITK